MQAVSATPAAPQGVSAKAKGPKQRSRGHIRVFGTTPKGFQRGVKGLQRGESPRSARLLSGAWPCLLDCWYRTPGFVAFDFAGSPNFREALAQADAALREKANDPMLATSAGAASKPPGADQRRVGSAGEFSEDFAQYEPEIMDRAQQAWDFEHRYLAPPGPEEVA